MFTIVVPMVYVSITTAVGNMVNMKRLGKILGNLVLTFIVTGLFAAALVLTVVNIWPPAANTSIQFANAEMAEAASVGDMIVNSPDCERFLRPYEPQTCCRSSCSPSSPASASARAAVRRARRASCSTTKRYYFSKWSA